MSSEEMEDASPPWGSHPHGAKISELVSQEFFATLSTVKGPTIHDICTALASAATMAVLRLAKLAR